MKFIEKLHMFHRFWRYRLRSEKDEIGFILSQQLSGTTVLDVGAHRGIYSYWMSKKAGEGGKVFAFEPQPELRPFLEDLKSAFHLDNLTVVDKALSEHSGSEMLQRDELSAGGASFHVGGVAEEVRVELISLDEYLVDKQVPRVSLIKADVEEHELSVFKGGARVIERDKPMLLFECQHHLAKKGELFRYLRNLGYDGFFFDRGKRVHYSKFDDAPYNEEQGYRNYVFVYDSH